MCTDCGRLIAEDEFAAAAMEPGCSSSEQLSDIAVHEGDIAAVDVDGAVAGRCESCQALGDRVDVTGAECPSCGHFEAGAADRCQLQCRRSRCSTVDHRLIGVASGHLVGIAGSTDTKRIEVARR